MAIHVLHPKEEFVDERGGITRIIDDAKIKLRGVLLITSRAGSVRANHYHKSDFHYVYIVSGRCEYSERPVDDPKAIVETVVLEPGDMVLTKPGIIHAIKFLENTVFYTFTTEKRQQDLYEEDTKRITIIE